MDTNNKPKSRRSVVPMGDITTYYVFDPENVECVFCRHLYPDSIECVRHMFNNWRFEPEYLPLSTLDDPYGLCFEHAVAQWCDGENVQVGKWWQVLVRMLVTHPVMCKFLDSGVSLRRLCGHNTDLHLYTDVDFEAYCRYSAYTGYSAYAESNEPGESDRSSEPDSWNDSDGPDSRDEHDHYSDYENCSEDNYMH